MNLTFWGNNSVAQLFKDKLKTKIYRLNYLLYELNLLEIMLLFDSILTKYKPVGYASRDSLINDFDFFLIYKCFPAINLL